VIASAAFVLACKLEDCPRPVDHVCKVVAACVLERTKKPGFTRELDAFKAAAFPGEAFKSSREACPVRSQGLGGDAPSVWGDARGCEVVARVA